MSLTPLKKATSRQPESVHFGAGSPSFVTMESHDYAGNVGYVGGGSGHIAVESNPQEIAGFKTGCVRWRGGAEDVGGWHFLPRHWSFA